MKVKVKNVIDFFKETALLGEPRKIKKLKKGLRKLGKLIKKESGVPARETELGPVSKKEFLKIVNDFKE